MENTANLGLFAVHKIVSEYAERLYALHGENAKRHKTVYISVNNLNLKFFHITSLCIIWDGLSLETISRYCPFKETVQPS
jgi:hypothetical protein